MGTLGSVSTKVLKTITICTEKFENVKKMNENRNSKIIVKLKKIYINCNVIVNN